MKDNDKLVPKLAKKYRSSILNISKLQWEQAVAFYTDVTDTAQTLGCEPCDVMVNIAKDMPCDVKELTDIYDVIVTLDALGLSTVHRVPHTRFEFIQMLTATSNLSDTLKISKITMVYEHDRDCPNFMYTRSQIRALYLNRRRFLLRGATKVQVRGNIPLEITDHVMAGRTLLMVLASFSEKLRSDYADEVRAVQAAAKSLIKGKTKGN